MTLPGQESASDWTRELLRQWLADLRATANISHDDLGQEPNGVALIKLLTALGVTFNPPVPHELRGTNAELRDLRLSVEKLARLGALEEEPVRAAQLAAELEDELGAPQPPDARNGGS